MKEAKVEPLTAPEPEKAVTPAVHSDMLWGGPRWIENASSEPVWVETKEQYWELMRKTGHRMKDQQESTTGTQTEVSDEEVAAAIRAIAPPPRVVPLMTQDEAHIYGAMKAVLKRYGLVESLWCEYCFSLGRHHGCRSVVNDKQVSIECRCGTASYRPPTGTTDMVLSTLSTSSITENDKTSGTVTLSNVPVKLPTIVLQDMEVLIIQRYVQALRIRQIEPRLFHRGCWTEGNISEDNAVGMKVTTHNVVIVCKCRQLFAQMARMERTVH